MSRRTFRTAAAAALTVLSVAAVPALAHAEDNDSDPSPGGNSCTLTDGTIVEDGDNYYEFQDNGSVLELECHDGTLCGTMYFTDHPGLPRRFACESWGETLELRNQARGARVLGVLATSAAGEYRIRPVVTRARPQLTAR